MVNLSHSFKDSSELVIKSSSGYTRSNGGIEFEDNNHEEADTLMIHHAVLTSRRNPANARIVIFSTDTDVLVLAVSNHHLIPHEHSGVYGIMSHRPRAYSSAFLNFDSIPVLQTYGRE